MLTKESVRKLIESYSPEAFAAVVKAACAPATFVAASRVIRLGGGLPDAAVLGVVRDLPGENGLAAPLLVADVTLDAKTLTERSSRILQFKVARKVLEQVCVNPPVPVDGIIVQGVFAFHGGGGAFRVSLVTAKAEDGKLVWSQVKRQSFYVENKPEQNATFIQRMTMNWSSLAAIREAFSVEKLTKEFYSQLFKWYERACEDERVEYPNDLATDKDNREDKNRKHLLRLITRLMFVWFLKKKGLVPDLFFDEKALKGILKGFNPVSKKQHQYYRAILQNLFFATLNSEIEEREFAIASQHHSVKTKYRYADEFSISRKDVIELFHKIPFLNGGLFECLDQEDDRGRVMYYDGFSLQEHHRDRGTLTWAHVPNDLFFDEEYGIIPLLKRYNFTVEENTPGDEDVALDPELLGKVFENLLGAYNPETEEVVRKSTGSFYTPREIVNYMVDESLIAYLEGKVDGGRARTPAAPPPDGSGRARTPAAPPDGRAVAPRPPSAVRALVKDGIRPDDAALCKTLIAAIEGAKILDPACGSGAFPMGALLKMTELLRILKKLPEDANLYDLKLKLIENCIFGVDIQEIAVQISKLRFFISLVCEQEPDWDAPNYGINTLPNLETKFVAANSLIGLKRTDAKDGDTSLQQTDLFFDSGEIAKIKEDLWEVRHKHFRAKTRKEKNALRREDKELRTKLAKRGKELGYSDDATRLMASWDPYNQNVHADFFDPAWMFNVKDGFDVVIGNPPYVDAKKIKSQVAELRGNYECYSGTADLSVYFYERGLEICSPDGTLAYICTNKFFVTEYGKQLRAYLRKHDLASVLDFEQCEVFEGVLVSSAITIVNNTPDPMREDLRFSKLEKLNHKDFVDEFLSRMPIQTTYPLSVLTESEWSFQDTTALQLKLKIEDGSEKIGDVEGVSVYRGVTTGFNPAFVIDSEKRKELIANDSKNATIIKKLLQGRNIRRWYYNESDDYLLQTGYDLDVQRKFPTVFSFMKQYKTEMVARSDQGANWWNLRACCYYDEFERPEKIIWGLTADKWAFTLDTEKHYLPSNGYIMTSTKVPTRFLLGLLNSQLLHYYFRFIGIMTAGGAYTLKAATIEALPIKKGDAKQQKPIIALVDKILAAKKKDPDADTSAWEREIDELVYDLYGLTDEERKIVEGGGRGYPPSEASFAKQSGYSGATALPNGAPGSGRGATRPTVARKPKTPKFEEEF